MTAPFDRREVWSESLSEVLFALSDELRLMGRSAMSSRSCFNLFIDNRCHLLSKRLVFPPHDI